MHSLSQPSSVDVAARAIKDPENRSVEIGIVCTILFHILLFFLAPYFPTEHIPADALHARVDDLGKQFDIVLAPDVAPPEPKMDPSRFVETNPDAPDNPPDNTNNFSNRNQQLGQPEPAKENAEEMPKVAGQDDIKNDTAIVSGDMSAPQSGAPVSASITTQDNGAQQQPVQARAEQVPLPGFEKVDGKADDGIATNVSDSKTPSNNGAEKIEGMRDAKSADGGLVSAEMPQHPTPRPRPRLTQARVNPLQNRIVGTDRIGPLGIDARWSEYGEYMQELIEIVQQQWDNILSEQRVSPAHGTRAIVTFTLSSEGQTKIVSVDETCGRPGSYACLSAIQDRAPYRKWTQQMIAVLGNEQTLTFSFYYQ